MRFNAARGILGIAAAMLLLARPPASAAPEEGREIKRRVLALYKSSEGQSPASNNTQELLEHPLDSLGLVVDYHDADQGLLSDEAMAPYRGVISFFNGPLMDRPEAYAEWVARQARAGRRVIVFGDYGAFKDRKTGRFVSHDAVNRAFGALGLRYDGFWENQPGRLVVKSVDEAMMSFEEPFRDAALESFVLIRSEDPANRVYLSASRRDMAASDSALVVATPRGGFVFAPGMLYEYRQEGKLKQRWRLNPYAFLANALDLEDEPRLDAATLNGRRLWMAQVEGDGFATPGPGNRLSVENVAILLEKYPWPVTASVITGELENDLRAKNAARALFAKPHVEPAAHSRTHPMDWAAGGIDLEGEIAGSAAMMDKELLPEGKKVRVFNWTGLCNPGLDALRAASAANLVTMNGPQTAGGFVNRLDSLYPSRTHLPPLVRRVGPYLQFNHRAANDHAITDEGKKPGAYDRILETFQATARDPEIPIHVYVHWYAGADDASLAALDRVFRWGASQEVSPVSLPEYAGIVEDFRSARLWALSPGRYRVVNSGACRTVVFPSTSSVVDMAESRGVLGYAPRHGRLFVFLDETPEHVIALVQSPAETPRLASASGWVEDWRAGEDGVSFRFRSFGPAVVTLAGLKGDHAVSVRPGGGSLSYRKETRRPEDGRITLEFSSEGTVRVDATPVGQGAAVVRRAGMPVMVGFVSIYGVWFLGSARKRRRGV